MFKNVLVWWIFQWQLGKQKIIYIVNNLGNFGCYLYSVAGGNEKSTGQCKDRYRNLVQASKNLSNCTGKNEENKLQVFMYNLPIKKRGKYSTF